ncbi:MAG: hypothetical protein R3228_13690 [Halioglobus sp.]|nr:hypothetical protein [Halioglobus sp.]
MNTALRTMISMVVVVSAWTQNALAQEAAAAPAPVEAFYCNYQDGKDIDDLMKIAERFSKWADESHPDYSAWILTPQFGQFNELPEVLWLGSNTSGDMMGKGLDAYLAEGADIQKEFDKVVDCYAHALASSVPVNAPDGPPGNGVVMFSQCAIAEGSDWSKAVAAHKQFSDAMREMGTKGSNWMFFPMLGGPADMGLDYWGVSTFASWTDYFSAYEIYVNGGGWQKQQDALAGAASCGVGTASVWNVSLVRMREG